MHRAKQVRRVGAPGAEAAARLKGHPTWLQVTVASSADFSQNLGNLYNVKSLGLRCLQPYFNLNFFIWAKETLLQAISCPLGC